MNKFKFNRRSGGSGAVVGAASSPRALALARSAKDERARTKSRARGGDAAPTTLSLNPACRSRPLIVLPTEENDHVPQDLPDVAGDADDRHLLPIVRKTPGRCLGRGP